MLSPPVNATLSSTTITLRWSRWTEPEPPPPRGDRIEGDHLAARGAQVIDPAPRQAERADGVVDDPDLDAGARALDQHRLEPVAGGVGREDVGLERDRHLRRGERGEHRGIGRATVAQHRDLAAGAPALLRSARTARAPAAAATTIAIDGGSLIGSGTRLGKPRLMQVLDRDDRVRDVALGHLAP